MDVQPGVIERLPNPDEYVANVRTAVDYAHEHQIPIIFVVMGFRAGLPEVSPRNKTFSTLKDAASRLVDPRPSIAAIGSDVVVVKRRVSAFTGSDLEVVLRAGNVGHLVLCGIATSGVVLSTVREASDKDYRITVLSDLCADPDPHVHAVLLEKVFPRQADVTTSAVWMSEGPT